MATPLASGSGLRVEPDMADGCFLLEQFFYQSIDSPDLTQQQAAIQALAVIMTNSTCESLKFSAGFALQKIINALTLSPNKLLKNTVVWFLRRFFEFQHDATFETLFALEQSTCEQIFDILLRSVYDVPVVAEDACYAIYFLAKCSPYLQNIAKFSEQCVWSLHIAAHEEAWKPGLRMASYEALHEVVRFVAFPVVSKLISHVACNLQRALHLMGITYGKKYIQYECRGLKIFLHKLGEGPPADLPISQGGSSTSEVAASLLKQHSDRFAELLVQVLDHTKDAGCWKDAVIAIGALAHAIGPAFDFEKHMLKFTKLWISGLQQHMRARELYDAMVGVMIRLSRALKGNILAYCNDILSQLYQDLFSTDLHEISKCSILCCYAELTLAIGADFHNYLGHTMNALGRLTSSKHGVLLKPESDHLICALLETHFAIIRCFKEPSVSHHLSPFASDILDFLRLICGLDMDARVTTVAIEFVRQLAAVHENIFPSLIYKEKSIQSFLIQCSISKNPLIKVCADLANKFLVHATHDLRWSLLEPEVSEKLRSALTLNPVEGRENEYSEQELLSISYNLPQGVDSYGKNCIPYVSLSSILLKDEEHFATRILAGKILLTALGSKKNWDFTMDFRSRFCILKCLVQTLSSCEAEACSMALQILKHIGGFSRGFYNLVWYELNKFLSSDVDHQLHVKYLCLEMLADVLKDVGLCPSSNQPDAHLMNELHKAVLKIIRASGHNDNVILNWLQILHYMCCFSVKLNDDITNFVSDAIEFPEVKIKAAALECLTAICPKYGLDQLAHTRIRSLILKAMEETDKGVAYRAIVFWIPVCEEAMVSGKNYKFVMEMELLVAILLKILFTRCTQLLEPTDPDQHEETPNLGEAAFKCLHSVAKTIGNKIIQLVEKDVLLGLDSSNGWHREAGIRALGSILVGPTREALSSLITSALSKILYAWERFTVDDSVGYAVTWTLSQILELHHPIVKTLIVPNYKFVIELWISQLRILDVPIVAKNACHALSSLVQGVDASMWYYLSPHFEVVVESLYAVGNDGIVELKVDANEALHEFMKCANDENCVVMLRLTTVIMNDLSHALGANKYTVEGLKDQCRSLVIITQKLGTSETYKPYFMQHVRRIITLLTEVIECGSVIVFKEAMIAVGAIAYVNGGAFEQHMENLEKCWEVGVQFFGQHLEVYLVMLAVIVDVCRVLKKKMLQFCDKIMTLLSINASDPQQQENWGPSISCICAIAGAVGDKKFLKHAINMLRDKTCIYRAHKWDGEDIWYLRPGLVEAYRAIFRGLKNCPDSDPLHRFADDTLDDLLELSNPLYEENDMDRVITRKVFEVLEHLSTLKGCRMDVLISQSSPLKYSEFNQELVPHLLHPRPSLIQLVQRSFQNESSKRMHMDFVGGYELVEVYAVHVKTNQPCDIYGAIEVNAGIVSQYLYNQEKGDAEPISSEETALFLNVLAIIPGVEAITLGVDLKHKVGDGGASTDEVWNKTAMILGADVRKGYDQPSEATINGKFGSVRISFIEYQYATPTYIKVSVILPPRGIHGQITAYNMRYPSIRRELFRRSSTNATKPHGDNLKVNLCEGVVVAPLNSILVVKADLWRNLVRGRQPSIPIPYTKFSAEFNVTPDWSTSKAYRIRGRVSVVKVEVHFGI